MSRKSDATKQVRGKGGFYRLMREWHGYLSAFSFLALLFFAATGIVLNHPDWLQGDSAPLKEATVKLAPAELARVAAAKAPGRALADAVGAKTRLVGGYREGEVSGDDLFVRLQSVRGSSDLRANLHTGEVAVTVERLSAAEVLNGLHRGEQAGAAWRLWIDILGGLLIILSILGYILFFSLRFRVRTALILTGLSLAAMVGLFVAFVP